jgi:hypothetical protein
VSGETTPEALRPPVALGCFFVVALLIGLAGIFVFAIIFFESGADTGAVRLDVPEAYALGSVEFVGPENLYLVRFRDGSFTALSDLDAANRANQGHRCRVAEASLSDPALAPQAASLSAAMSPRAAGATAILREACLGAVYDIAGVRLLGDGPNLERFNVVVGADGHLRVDTSRRVCSQRSGGNPFASIPC